MITAIGTVIVSRRRHSGNIRTAEAETLWNESRAIRKEQRAELDKVNARLEATEEAHRQCQIEVATLRAELAEVRKM